MISEMHGWKRRTLNIYIYIYIYIYMYSVCVCVCMFLLSMCVFVCMYVCVFVCIWFVCACVAHGRIDPMNALTEREDSY